MKNVTFRQLRVFTEVARHLSFVRAAEALHLTPPAVTMQIKELEAGVTLPLFDRQVEGFGELFRMLSYEDIGTSTLQSRALAGIANHTVIFAVPGSTNACRTAWEQIILQQLDARHRPCNFIPHMRKK